MPLQDFIHKLTEGSGSRALKLALVFFAMVGLGVWYDLAAFKNLSSIEGMDAAQLARNLGEGQRESQGQTAASVGGNIAEAEPDVRTQIQADALHSSLPNVAPAVVIEQLYADFIAQLVLPAE